MSGDGILGAMPPGQGLAGGGAPLDVEADRLAPSPPDEAWTRLVALPPSDKVAVGMRLDRDVVAWFKSQGPGYQARINAVLRRYVEAHRAKP